MLRLFTWRAAGWAVVGLASLLWLGCAPQLLNQTQTTSGTSNGPVNEIQASLQNRAPVAIASADQEARAGDTVTLRATASYDADGDALTFYWRQVDGPAVELQAPFASIAHCTVPADILAPVDLTFRCQVTDGFAAGAATVVVSIIP
jgi:hypothetical protein